MKIKRSSLFFLTFLFLGAISIWSVFFYNLYFISNYDKITASDIKVRHSLSMVLSWFPNFSSYIDSTTTLNHYSLFVESTAYWYLDPVDASGTGLAFDGKPAIPFYTIAVDPKVIPLGSRVYVPNIGWCLAHDTGSAIKGNIVDIAMDSKQSAIKWGRRKFYVVVVPPSTSSR